MFWKTLVKPSVTDSAVPPIKNSLATFLAKYCLPVTIAISSLVFFKKALIPPPKAVLPIIKVGATPKAPSANPKPVPTRNFIASV